MSTPTRLANKTIWTLEDIVAITKNTIAALRPALARAKKKQDIVQVASIATAIADLAQIERKAIANRHGGYDD